MKRTYNHLKSFIEVAADSHFSLQNLPFGIFSTRDNGRRRVGVAIGDWVLDLAVLQSHVFFQGAHLRDETIFDAPTLNAFMALGRPAWREARSAIQKLLQVDNPLLRDDAVLRELALRPLSDITLHLPAQIGDYTDFYSSKEHASNVGSMFRGPENPLLPNWTHLPVGYHGRASSIIPSGTNIYRPHGQTKKAAESNPTFGPSQEMDFELEMGFFIGPGNTLGQPIPTAKASKHIFGLVLVNDWSARDIQRWEYRPLGPFLSKNFATSISPWVVTLDALEPFRCQGPAQEPEPLPYLQTDPHQAFDIHLEVSLQNTNMAQPKTITRSNTKHLYWNMAQQLAHHTITGCNVRSGDLLASGTISGPSSESAGSMLELSWRGAKPIKLTENESRAFLQDGDRVTMTGWCQGDGYRVGFGEVTAVLLPALDL